MLQFTGSEELYQKTKEYLALGVSSGIRMASDPILYFERADGPYYYDVDGNEFIDYTLAWGPLILGSNHPAINSAVIDQLGKSYTLGAQHRLEPKLSELMVKSIPGVEQVIFSNTGTEAVQAAMRICKTYTNRTKVVKFEGHYHGWLSNILVSYHPSKAQLGAPAASCGGQYENDFSDLIILPWNDLEALKTVFQKYGDDIACVISEPILANSGSCMPKAGYLEGIVDICKEYGAVSVFDEVITGFRIALGGAREYFGVIPDMSIYAKAMAGGFTMSGIGSTQEILSVLAEGKTIHAGTYNGTSHNLAAAIATIETLSQDGMYEKMHGYGQELRAHIEKEATKNGIQLVTTGVGSVFSVHFGLDNPPLDYEAVMGADVALYKRFHNAMLHNNVLLLPDGRWYIGASHTEKELERTMKAVTKVLKHLH